MPSDPVHDRAVILSTGDELLTGQLQDSNARWIAEQLVAAGILPVEIVAVGDDLEALTAALTRAARRVPLIIMSGGLGPTDGDLTREAVARVTGDHLVLDDSIRQTLAARLASRGRAATERQLRQATRPSRATALPNEFGTAPGLHARIALDGPTAALPHGSCDLFCLPGPPGELRPMFHADVRPRLRPPPAMVFTRLLHIIGLAEADCVDRLGSLTRRDGNPLVGITASGGILTLRIRFTGAAAAAPAELDSVESRVRDALGVHVLPAAPTDATGFHALVHAALDGLKARARTLAVVESCTGGMLGELLTTAAGASDVFRGGFITYSNDLKVDLGVERAALDSVGAVSAEVALQMARAGAQRARADFALAITGIAGPGGGTADKPVGTVFIALACPGPGAGAIDVHTRRFAFTGDREDIRRRAAMSALGMLHFALNRQTAAGSPRMLWEVR